MPRKSKVTAISIDEPIVEAESDKPDGLIVAQMTESEMKTDAQEMTDMVKAIDTSEDNIVVEVLPVPEAPKAKPPRSLSTSPTKRTPRAKSEQPSTVLPEEVVETMVEDAPKEKSPKENIKVECPDCGKKMSAKTLKYSHGPNCLFKKLADKEEAEMMTKVPEAVIEAEVQKRMSCAKAERLNRRQKQIESLVANAF